MIKLFKSYFQPPSSLDHARQRLRDHELELVKTVEATDYAVAMTWYRSRQIERLQNYINGSGELTATRTPDSPGQ